MADAPSNWDPVAEEKYMLQLVPLMREINDFTKSKLPPGTDFGLLVCVPAAVAGTEGRVIALTTNRERLQFAAMSWLRNTLET